MTPVVPEHRGPVVQSLSRVQLFLIPWTTARQSSLSITISWSLLKFMSIKSVMPSNHLTLCDPSMSLYTGRAGRGETKEVSGAPEAGQEEEGGRGPFSSRASGGPKIQSVTWPDLTLLGEGPTPQVWLRPPHCPQKGTWPRASPGSVL